MIHEWIFLETGVIVEFVESINNQSKGGKNMIRKISGYIIVFLVLIVTGAVHAENTPPKVGSPLPAIELPRPGNEADLKYLGLSGLSFGSTFKVNQIKSKVVIIQIYSMYCPYCQAEAPNVNRLYGLIENNPALKGKIKIIGIGAGNTPFEVATYKKKYAVPFPLFNDKDFKNYKILGETRTPYFIAAKINERGGTEVIYSRLGAIEDNNLFLEQIAKLAGLR
ncbi:MAG: redoxin domain-containing protein [Smithella sp.]